MQVQTINISIPRPLLQMIENQAKDESRTRSGLIQEAIRTYLSQKRAWQEIFTYGEKKAKRLKLKPKETERIVNEYRKNR